MENSLIDFLRKHFGSWETAEITKDDGKTVTVWIDFGDDENGTITINRRKGDNGNYRIVVCEL